VVRRSVYDESNELSMHITMYLYPNIFLNSEVLSSFEIDEKAIKTPDYFNTTRYVRRAISAGNSG
jgi:hypothetical protein